MIFTEKDIARFHAKYIPEPNSGCWLWDAAIFRRGYGMLGVGGKVLKAHRISYEIHVGPIPDGLFVCHKCDVPGCVNPAHLFLGTCADNLADMRAKGREARGDRSGARTQPHRRPRGERHGNVRLTDDQVAAIRHEYASGMGNQYQLASKYGTHQTNVSLIVNRKGRVHP